MRAFGAATSAPRANVIYFDLLGKTVVVYSSRMAIACLAAVLLLGAVAAVRASRSGKLRLVALIRGTLSSFLAIVGAVVVVTAVWRALTALNPAIEGLLHSFTTWMWCAITGTVVVAAGATAAFQRLMGRRITTDERMGGAVMVAALLAVLAMVWQPQVSYLVVWPLVGAALVWLVRSRVDSPALRDLLIFTQAIPVALVVAPLVYLVMVALPPAQWGAGAVLVGIVTTLIAPSFDTPGNVREYAWRPSRLRRQSDLSRARSPPCLGRSMLNARDRTISFMPSTRNWEKRSGALPMQRSTNGQGLDSVILLSSKRFRHSSWAAPESTLSPRRPSKNSRGPR